MKQKFISSTSTINTTSTISPTGIPGTQNAHAGQKAHKTTSYNSQTDNFVGPSGESKTMTGNAIISGKDLLMMALVRFYKQNNNQNMYRIIPIIESNCAISLRLIDWFVTNYSKKYNTIIKKQKNVDGMEYFNVYISYRQQLKAFSKQQFDPFRRRDRIRFVYDKDNNWVETTIGQLNFFKWILQNNILDFIMENIDVIEADMMTSQKKQIDGHSIQSEVNPPNTNLKKKKNTEETSEKVKATAQASSSRKQNRIDLLNIGIKKHDLNDARVGPKIVSFN